MALAVEDVAEETAAFCMDAEVELDELEIVELDTLEDLENRELDVLDALEELEPDVLDTLEELQYEELDILEVLDLEVDVRDTDLLIIDEDWVEELLDNFVEDELKEIFVELLEGCELVLSIWRCWYQIFLCHYSIQPCYSKFS